MADELTDEVEKVARALCDHHGGLDWWQTTDDEERESYRGDARVAIDALRGPADDTAAAVERVRALAVSLIRDANAYQYAAPGSYDAGARTAYEAIAARINDRLDGPADETAAAVDTAAREVETWPEHSAACTPDLRDKGQYAADCPRCERATAWLVNLVRGGSR